LQIILDVIIKCRDNINIIFKNAIIKARAYTEQITQTAIILYNKARAKILTKYLIFAMNNHVADTINILDLCKNLYENINNIIVITEYHQTNGLGTISNDDFNTNYTTIQHHFNEINKNTTQYITNDVITNKLEKSSVISNAIKNANIKAILHVDKAIVQLNGINDAISEFKALLVNRSLKPKERDSITNKIAKLEDEKVKYQEYHDTLVEEVKSFDILLYKMINKFYEYYIKVLLPEYNKQYIKNGDIKIKYDKMYSTNYVSICNLASDPNYKYNINEFIELLSNKIRTLVKSNNLYIQNIGQIYTKEDNAIANKYFFNQSLETTVKNYSIVQSFYDNAKNDVNKYISSIKNGVPDSVFVVPQIDIKVHKTYNASSPYNSLTDDEVIINIDTNYIKQPPNIDVDVVDVDIVDADIIDADADVIDADADADVIDADDDADVIDVDEEDVMEEEKPKKKKLQKPVIEVEKKRLNVVKIAAALTSNSINKFDLYANMKRVADTVEDRKHFLNITVNKVRAETNENVLREICILSYISNIFNNMVNTGDVLQSLETFFNDSKECEICKHIKNYEIQYYFEDEYKSITVLYSYFQHVLYNVVYKYFYTSNTQDTNGFKGLFKKTVEPNIKKYMNHLDILFKYIENKHIKQINELQKERDNNIRIARQKVKDRVAISLYNVLPAKTKKDVKKDLKAVAAATATATVAKTPVAKGAPKSAKSAKTTPSAKTPAAPSAKTAAAKTAAVAKTTPAAKTTPSAKTTAAVAKTTPAAKATAVTPAVTPAVAASRTSGRVATPKRLFDL
jgi:hypothetical protein